MADRQKKDKEDKEKQRQLELNRVNLSDILQDYREIKNPNPRGEPLTEKQQIVVKLKAQNESLKSELNIEAPTKPERSRKDLKKPRKQPARRQMTSTLASKQYLMIP